MKTRVIWTLLDVLMLLCLFGGISASDSRSLLLMEGIAIGIWGCELLHDTLHLVTCWATNGRAE